MRLERTTAANDGLPGPGPFGPVPASWSLFPIARQSRRPPTCSARFGLERSP